MFTITCDNCGRTSKVTTFNSFIIVKGDIQVDLGDNIIESIRCVGCNNNLVDEK